MFNFLRSMNRGLFWGGGKLFQMPNASILAGSYATFLKISSMCRAFKQPRFLLKSKMKNKGNEKNIFPSFCLLPDLFLYLLIYRIERILVVLSEPCTLAAPIRARGVRALAVLQGAKTVHQIFSSARNWAKNDGEIGNEWALHHFFHPSVVDPRRGTLAGGRNQCCM